MAKNNLGRNIALGATGLAFTAGAVAVGIMLGNKTNRKSLSRKAKRGLDTLANVAGNLQQPLLYSRTIQTKGNKRGYVVAHQISRSGRSKKRSKER